MKNRILAPIAIASILATLTACAKPGNFPSLAPRAVERELPTPAAAPSPPAPADPALGARIVELRDEAEAGQRAFAAEAASGRTAIAQAGKAGSESWIAAQQAVSRLEAARSRTATALASLDQLAVERAAQPTNPGDYQALLAAVEASRILADAQKAEMVRMTKGLSAP